MLKGCQNSLAVQEHAQETADQMLQIKTAHQPQLSATFKRRIKMPYTPFVNIPGRGRATKAPAPERFCPLPKLFKGAAEALWEGFESSEMETTCEHPPGKSPMCKAAGRPPTNSMCQGLTGCLTCLGTKQEWGQKGSHPLGRAWHLTCVFAGREEPHSGECAGEAAW